jgi:hypothetical protein
MVKQLLGVGFYNRPQPNFSFPNLIQNGYFFGYGDPAFPDPVNEATDLGIANAISRGNSLGWVRQQDWNVDPADGTKTLPNMTTWFLQNSFQIDVEGNGCEIVNYSVMNPATGRFVLVHTSTLSNTLNAYIPYSNPTVISPGYGLIQYIEDPPIGKSALCVVGKEAQVNCRTFTLGDMGKHTPYVGATTRGVVYIPFPAAFILGSTQKILSAIKFSQTANDLITGDCKLQSIEVHMNTSGTAKLGIFTLYKNLVLTNLVGPPFVPVDYAEFNLPIQFSTPSLATAVLPPVVGAQGNPVQMLLKFGFDPTSSPAYVFRNVVDDNIFLNVEDNLALVFEGQTAFQDGYIILTFQMD